MAKQNTNNQSTSSVKTNSFDKGMVKDIDKLFAQDGTWFHARNAINNSTEGNLGTLGNEPSNYLCAQIPNTPIGFIHLYAEKWVVFSAGNGNSEIGMFDEELCTYNTVVSNPCLNFSTRFLVKGVAKENFDCTWQVYFADANNPDRTMNMDRPPFIETCVTDPSGCVTCTPTADLDCEKLRIAKIIRTPCVSVAKGNNGGNLLNGSYYVVVAYVLNGQRVTDYFTPSNVQPLFDHQNPSSSIDVTIDRMDTDLFDEFELVLVRTINQQTSAKKIGIYSTRLNSISIDYVDESLVSIPIEQIPVRSPSYEKSQAIYENGPYMLRIGPTAKFDFNYQPLANLISAKWKAVKYPVDYYRKGGNVTSYLRDEQYPFWIRWLYNTGEKSSSYHIPGRPPLASDLVNAPVNQDNIEVLYEGFASTPFWEVYNTATFAPAAGTLPDGGQIIAEGQMGYWESTERYPDTKPEIWNSSFYPWSDPGNTSYDLCGKPIRHHKMPDNQIINHFTTNLVIGPNGPYTVVDGIVVLGVDFDNILYPRDNNGAPIPGIVGYEILRGSREGNKTIVAKGMLNNMRKYEIYDEDNTEPGNSRVGLFQNYPYNPCFAAGSSLELRDWFLSTEIGPEGVPGSQGPVPNFLYPAPGQFDPAPLFNLDPSDPLAGISQRYHTFHSPDTQFRNPFLSIKELKLYGEIAARVKGNFSEVPGHPKEKLLTDSAFILAAIAGLAAAALAVRGQKTVRRTTVHNDNAGLAGLLVGPTSGPINSPGIVGTGLPESGVTGTAVVAAAKLASDVTDVTQSSFIFLPVDLIAGPGGLMESTVMPVVSLTAGLSPGVKGYGEDRDIQGGPFTYTDFLTRITSGFAMITYYFSVGTDAALRLIDAIVQPQQYALRYLSHGDYTEFQIGNATAGTRRRFINESMYLDNQLQEFSDGKTVNNLFRGRTVALELSHLIGFTGVGDNTAQTISSAVLNSAPGGNVTVSSTWTATPQGPYDNPTLSFNTTACSYYGAVKLRLRNQYGQMDAVKQITIGSCNVLIYDEDDPSLPPNVPPTTPPYNEPFSSPIFFGGDTYIGRYTEKNTFFYFYDWLYNQPDGYQMNYRQKYMINYPRYWADFTKFETSDFVASFVANPADPSLWVVPSSKHHLDRLNTPPGAPWLSGLFEGIQFGVQKAFFYLFNSGVRDFMVESEINVDLRDWGDVPEEKHYDPYRFTDLQTLFDTSIIKAGNFYKYDFSLSITRIFNNFISWGNMQTRDYNPTIAETCYTSYPNRIIYSLPQNLESKKDYWQVFLVNNYKDFKSRVTAVKPINKNGALIMFETESPVQFQGVDTLQTELGTKVTIGDGGLFNQPLQALVNSDTSYEYGSCQDRLSIINTPAGLFWISQNQGKIFNLANGLKDISAIGNKWWFNNYLPFALLEDFPNFEVIDNPVAGIGCQAIYDNQDEIVYFSKRDYKLKPGLVPGVDILYSGSGTSFGTPSGLRLDVGDPSFFDDASWTMSFDPKNQAWIGFHDWHPDLLVPSKKNFLSTNHFQAGNQTQGGIWRHNDRVDSFCNFYGTDYPFEVDFVQSTGQIVNTMRSIEYFMEAYVYAPNETDMFQVLDFNFDHAVIYNSEQVSGTLVLNIVPKNNPALMIQYPIINPTTIDILYSKEEQKYRFNQFWDITDNRGEFTNVQRSIWLTGPNGYIRTLNPNNLNYSKDPFQRKKFRHYANNVMLYRNISGNKKILLHLVNAKNLYSPR